MGKKRSEGKSEVILYNDHLLALEKHSSVFVDLCLTHREGEGLQNKNILSIIIKRYE